MHSGLDRGRIRRSRLKVALTVVDGKGVYTE